MIIVRLNGGLGNQMFQYAAGRRLALVHNTALKLNLTDFTPSILVDTPRTFELHHLRINAEVATARELQQFKELTLRGPWWRLMAFIPERTKPTHVREKYFHFDHSVLDLPDNVYLDGFWQSEKYFADQAAVIRQELTEKDRLDPRNRKMLDEIRTRNAIGVHVRRGDMATNPIYHKYHGLCSPVYYRRGIAYLAKQIKRPYLYIFSDDPEWCRGHLRFGFPTTYVDHNSPEKVYEDLRLLSACQHFIIANSSFSWWGAWLSENKRKIVIAPRRWFADAPHNTKDLLPRSWIKL